MSRIDALDWDDIESELSGYGCAVLSELLSAEECRELVALYPDDSRFRSHVIMSRHGFRKGEYKYFTHPLPASVTVLRSELYARLAPVANHWNKRMGLDSRYPAEHREFITQCHARGLTRPTPLLLQYVAGDFNCLHQDLYGDLAFPLQVAVLLSEPGEDFTGGKFVLTEQRPRMQSSKISRIRTEESGATSLGFSPAFIRSRGNGAQISERG